jgi:hypothetical protein
LLPPLIPAELFGRRVVLFVNGAPPRFYGAQGGELPDAAGILAGAYILLQYDGANHYDAVIAENALQQLPPG